MIEPKQLIASWLVAIERHSGTCDSPTCLAGIIGDLLSHIAWQKEQLEEYHSHLFIQQTSPATQQFAEAKKDSERLDWLGGPQSTESFLSLHGEIDIRLAIDSAMKQSKGEV